MSYVIVQDFGTDLLSQSFTIEKEKIIIYLSRKILPYLAIFYCNRDSLIQV